MISLLNRSTYDTYQGSYYIWSLPCCIVSINMSHPMRHSTLSSDCKGFICLGVF